MQESNLGWSSFQTRANTIEEIRVAGLCGAYPQGRVRRIREDNRRILCLSNWALRNVAKAATGFYPAESSGGSTRQPAGSRRFQAWFNPISQDWKIWRDWRRRKNMGKNSAHRSIPYICFPAVCCGTGRGMPAQVGSWFGFCDRRTEVRARLQRHCWRERNTRAF